MIDVKSPRCNEEGCNKISPVFNDPTETKGLYCFEHKKENMIDVKSPRCNEEGCNKRPNFNDPNEIKGLYCFEHKKNGMIDVKNKKCNEEGCNKHPVYNDPTEKKGLYCYEHKKDGMINVISPRCNEEECNKICPVFNDPTEKKGLYCYEHKKDGMINVRNKSCQVDNCKQDAIFGIKDKKPQYCLEHKKEGMINLILENKCSILDCENEYDYIIKEVKYCLKHSPESYEINLKRLCKYCDIKENSKYICKECKKRSTKKEWAIVKHLRKNIDTKFEYNSSKMLQGCSKRRPDVYFELSTYCLIVEIDEHQHRTYEDICECSRINEIVNGIGGKSVIILRFNPDTTKHKGKRLKLKLSDKIDLLVDKVKEELVKNYETFQVKIIQLYYDDDYETYQEIKEEIITDKVTI